VIEYEEALRRIRDTATELGSEWVKTQDGGGRVLARAVESPSSLPAFTNSAMDGFAVRCGGETLPARLRLEVVGRALAGDPPGTASGFGRAWEIATGAPLPAGLDAVVPLERVIVDDVAEPVGSRRTIQLTGEVRTGDNVRVEGEDFRAGASVLPAGRRLGPVEVMALSGLGVPRVRVRRRPRAAILSTGDEVEADLDAPLAPGHIRDSSGPFLREVLRDRGVLLPVVRTVGDEMEPFLEHLAAARDGGADLVVSTGAVSRGRRDFVPDALDRIGGKVLFHGAAIRPGKPLLVGTLPGGGVFFGLPGNPVSTVVGYRFFVHPFLRALAGEGSEVPWHLPLLDGVGKRPGVRSFLRARVESDPGGRPGVRILPGQEAFRLESLLHADAWVVLHEDTHDLRAGAVVETLGLLEPLPTPLR
jgi:molybdopterin molybdotransferase